MPVIKSWLFRVLNLIGSELEMKGKSQSQGQSPFKYQYNIKQTSDENEEKLSIRGLLVDTKFLRIVYHKNCMADSNKNY